MPAFPWDDPETAEQLAAEHLSTDDPGQIGRALRNMAAIRPPWAAAMPGYLDPDDWREPELKVAPDGNIVEPDPEDVEQARELVGLRSAEHDARHAYRGHPFCVPCGIREANYDAYHGRRAFTSWDQRPESEPIDPDVQATLAQIDDPDVREFLTTPSPTPREALAGRLVDRCTAYLTEHGSEPQEARDYDPADDSPALAYAHLQAADERAARIAAERKADQLASTSSAPDLGTLGILDVERSQAARVGQPETEAVEDRTERARRLFPRLDWHDLWADDSEEEWIHYPLLPARRSVVLYSPPKVGKSLMLLELAVTISRGGKFLGWQVERRYRVLYVDFENDPRGDVRSRLQAMGHGPDDLDHLDYLSFPTMAGLDTERGAVELLEAVHAYGAEVIVIDTVSRAIDGEENSNDTWLGLYRHTGLRLKQAGVAVLRLDHSGKDESKGPRGGSAKSGDVDATWRLSRVVDGRFRLECVESRLPIPEKDLSIVRLASPLRHVVETRQSDTQAKIAEIIRLADAEELPATAGRDAVKLAVGDRVKASNDTFAEAVRIRKAKAPVSTPELSGTGQDSDPSADLSPAPQDRTGQGQPNNTSDQHKHLSRTAQDGSGQAPLGLPVPVPSSLWEGTGDSQGQDNDHRQPACPSCGRSNSPDRDAAGLACLACTPTNL